MSLQAYVFTLAESFDDADGRVHSWIDECDGREFFDYAELVCPGASVLLEEIPVNELRGAWDETEQRLSTIAAEISQSKASGDRKKEGFLHFRYGNILMENPCSDMPFFNMEDWDWSVPNKVPRASAGKKWYAVKVDFYC
jgi:hypothetical protein